MKTLVIGYGSIGQRHSTVLHSLGYIVGVVSKRNIETTHKHFLNIEEALDWDPKYVVIANETSAHQKTLEDLEKLGFKGTALVEKPIYANKISKKNYSFKVFVGFNLRFFSAMQFLKNKLQDENILYVDAYVGQHLSLWRRNRDFKDSYSAKKDQGGGALRDLSHELDYVHWLTGPWDQLTALSDKISDLPIESDDSFCILATSKKVPQISIRANYLDQNVQRIIKIITTENSYFLNFLEGRVLINSKETKDFKYDVNEMLKLEHDHAINGKNDYICDLKSGVEVMDIIDAVEKASKTKKWVKLEYTM